MTTNRSTRRQWMKTTLALGAAWAPANRLIQAGGAFSGVVARPSLEARMTDALRPFLDQAELSGVVAVTGSSRGVEALVAMGRARIEGNLAMAADTPFRIASMTKPLTAVGVMMLAAEGKLKPSDLLAQHLPAFQGIQVAEKQADGKMARRNPKTPLKVEHLMSHTSGLPAYPKDLGDVYGRRKPSLAASIDALAREPLAFDPGSRWAYCNPGIDALGRLIEVLSGQDYADFLSKRLFGPLGMANTRFFPTPEDRARVAAIYERKGGKLVEVAQNWGTPPTDAIHPVPAGGLWSTGPDVAKAAAAFLQLARDSRAKGVLEGSRFQEMLVVRTTGLKAGFTDGMGFGYGWAVVDQPTGVTQTLSKGSFGHGGAFGTQYWMDPGKDRYVVLMIQRQGLANGDASPMRKALQDAVFTA